MLQCAVISGKKNLILNGIRQNYEVWWSPLVLISSLSSRDKCIYQEWTVIVHLSSRDSQIKWEKFQFHLKYYNFLENDGVNLGKKNYIFIIIGGILVLWNVLAKIFRDYWIFLTLPFLRLCSMYFSNILYYYSSHFPPFFIMRWAFYSN